MLDNYINNFESIVSSILFGSFKGILLLLTILLTISLIMLAIGCLIKSQKIKSRFLTSTLCLLLGNIFFLCIPFFVIHFKNLM